MARLFYRLTLLFITLASTLLVAGVPLSCGAEEQAAVKKPSRIIIENNKFYQNVLTGIRIKGDIPITIKSTDLYNNGRGGINIEKHAYITLSEVKIYGNGGGGINLENPNSITVKNSRIHSNKMGGIRIQKKPDEENNLLHLLVEDSKIYLNGQAAIRAQPEPGAEVILELRNSEFYDNGRAGIRLENNTHLIARGNIFDHNDTAGIIAHESIESPTLDIYQNIILNNIGPGINIYSGESGDIGIRNNYIYHNERSGIILGFREHDSNKEIEIDIINNTIVANGSNEQGAGVRNESDGTVNIINNIIAYNYVTGIRTSGCGDFSTNLMYANGFVKPCCEDPTFAPFYVEKVQYAGCPGRGSGGLIADPLFIDPDNYNYQLQNNSPALGAGKIMLHHENVREENLQYNDIGATGGPYAGEL